ncbi:MAG: cyclopropane fatty acyl phospholipid synthase [Tepidisphaeraceae bacterium]
MNVAASSAHATPGRETVRNSWAARVVIDLLESAGILVNGSRAWDLTVHDERLFRRLIVEGSVGLGDAYVDGWWDCDAIDQLVDRLITADVPRRMPLDLHGVIESIAQRIVNLQTLARARRNTERHYDLGNDLFAAMLDPTMTYTCGYWKDAITLEAAQVAKLDLVCRKLGLTPGQRLLDIGCGWGSFLRFAAERYGTSGVGVTISSRQVALARQRCAALPVEIRLQDYRAAEERFDHVVSLGMFEHVGVKNHRTYMRSVHRCLGDRGLFLLHTIAASTLTPNATRGSQATWIARRIFPGAIIPSMKQIGAAIDDLFVVEDVQNFGADYDPTLMAWFANFDAAWLTLRERYGERFYRTWKYYLLSCAGGFRARAYQLWQLVLSKRGVRRGYVSVR